MSPPQTWHGHLICRTGHRSKHGILGLLRCVQLASRVWGTGKCCGNVCVCVYVLMTVPQTDSGLAEKEIHTAVDPVDF